MTIETVKNQIENKTIDDSLLIFVLSDKTNDFIPMQYINEISSFKDLQIRSVSEDELPEIAISESTINLFGTIDKKFLYVYHVKKGNFDMSKYDDLGLINCKNLYIICDGVTSSTKEKYTSFIVDVPKLEEWQIYDYACTKAEGAGEKELKYLVGICKNDIYRLDNELTKLAIFNPEERNSLFKEFCQDGMFNDIVGDTIFNFTNALMDKDFDTIARLYPHISTMGIEYMSLLGILLKNIRNIILVNLQPSPNIDNTFGMSTKQIGFLKKYKQKYTAKQLYKAFDFLTDIDRKIKSGIIDTNILIDYLITFMLTL